MIRQQLDTNCIRMWNASFYDISTKKWIYGVLELSANCILFCQQSDTDGSSICGSVFKLELSFTRISHIARSSSSFIFPSITIFTSENNKYWFSSFANREETLLFLEHFFHPALVNKKSADPAQQSELEGIKQSSSMGKKLLRSVVDSNKTLSTAGVQLDEQGNQLRNASVKMMEMNNDLNVASRFTQGLQSWFPRWRIPDSYNEKDNFCIFNQNEALSVSSVDALYCDVTPNANGSHLKCNVTIGKDGLWILDIFQKIIQHFKWTDISRVQIISLWEFSVTQFHIGKPDRKCKIISVNIPPLLKELENYRFDKIEYITSEIESVWSDFKLRKEQQIVKEQRSSSLYDEGTSFDDVHQQSQEIPNDHEMTDLSKELTGLKSLAQNVQKVQDEQLKDIDELTSAVTRGSDRLSKLNKTLKKL